MSFIASSLGVDCMLCHVEGHFDKDDKKPKQIARAMMRMTLALNKTSFDSRRDVTCYSCHRGSRHPADTPSLSNDTLPARSPNNTQPVTGSSASEPSSTTPLPTNLPTVSEILNRYISALGGAAAIEQMTSLSEKGMIANSVGSTPLEILTAASDKQDFVRHLPRGEATTIVNGDSAWFVMPGRPANPLHGAELDAARLDADLQFPLHLCEIFPELRREYPETVNGHEAWLLIGEREGLPPVRLYFDQQTGLLIRQIRYADSAIGFEPTQIDYSDFRAVDKIQFPHRIAISQPNSRETIVFSRIDPNYPMNNVRFEPHSTAPPDR